MLPVLSTCLESETGREFWGSREAWPQDLVSEGFPVGTSLGDGKPLLRPWAPSGSEALRGSWASASGQSPAAHHSQLQWPGLSLPLPCAQVLDDTTVPGLGILGQTPFPFPSACLSGRPLRLEMSGLRPRLGPREAISFCVWILFWLLSPFLWAPWPFPRASPCSLGSGQQVQFCFPFP